MGARHFDPPGVRHQLELGIQFARWADQLHYVPTPAMVMRRFNVSRATAYRYLSAYRNCAPRFDTMRRCA